MNHNIQYFIDPEKEGVKNDKEYKGVVTCVINDTAYEVQQTILKAVQRADLFSMRNIWDFPAKYNIQPRYEATAYCGKGDEWDEERGKLIARTRALTKLRNDTIRVLNDFSYATGNLRALIENESNALYVLVNKEHDFPIEA